MKHDAHFIADVLGVPIAMGADGVWRWYRNTPHISGEMWIENTSSLGTLPSGIIEYAGDWKDSLAEPGCAIAISSSPEILKKAVDFRVRWSNRIDTYLKDGYRLVGRPMERNKRFYCTLVKLSVPSPCKLKGYRIVKAIEADSYITDEWKVASEPFRRSDGELFVEMVKI